jgi:hypothetical protein
LAPEIEEEGGPEVNKGGSASLPEKLDRYGQARHRATQILGHLDGLGNTDGSARAADRLRHCGEYLLFRHYHTVDEVKLHAAEFCKQHLVCPLCAIRRSAKQVGAYADRLEVILANEPQLRPVFITYTVKNGFDLAERMAHLRGALRKLTKRRRHARNGFSTSTTWRHLAGAVGALEATYSSEHGWHPHMHMVGLCDGWMDQRAMVEEWRQLTGDSFIVGIQQLDPSKPPLDAFLETFKYAVKFSSLSPPLVWEAATTLRRQRLVFSLGCFRGVPEPDELTDVPLDGLPFSEWYFRYIGSAAYSLVPGRSTFAR